MAQTLSAGAAKIDITPDFPVGMSGYGCDATRLWEKIEERLYLTCVAVSNGEKTLLLFTVDACNMPIDYQKRYRKRISEETGVPEEHIFFGATHAHNASSIYFKEQADRLEIKTLEGAVGALSDLAPATFFAGMPEIQGMNFTRHYVTDKGERYSFNMGIPEGAVLVGHSTKSDPGMSMLKFCREGKKDIVMMNFQAHCDSAYPIGFTSICPSWVGRLRDKMESLRPDILAVYFTGTSGNQAQVSKLEWEKHGLKWFEYGEKLGEFAVSHLEEMVPVKGSDIRTLRLDFPVTPNHTEKDKYKAACEATALRNTDPEAAMKICRENGIASLGHAKGIKSREETRIPDFLELGAFCIGDVGFVTNTNETCSDQGLFIKEHNPFPHTFILTANRGYLAPREAYEYHAYEAVGGSAYYVQGTAEAMADKWLEMLRQLHG